MNGNTRNMTVTSDSESVAQPARDHSDGSKARSGTSLVPLCGLGLLVVDVVLLAAGVAQGF